MQWGPWVDHDGRKEPVPSGTYIQVEFISNIPRNHGTAWKVINDRTVEGIVISPYDFSHRRDFIRVLRYRIRKPKGLTMLQDIVANPERELELT